VAPDGTLTEAAVVVIEHGAIKEIRTGDEVPAGMPAADYRDAVLCPGLIDVHSSLSAAENNRESAYAVDPQATAADMFDRHHRDLKRALSGGITSVLLVPAGNNLVSGVSVLVKTCGSSEHSAVVGEGPIKMSMGPGILEHDREPTSRAGAVHLLDTTFESAGSPDADPRLRALVQGKAAALVECPSRLDVETMMEAAGRYDLRLAVLLSAEPIESAAVLAGSGASVVLSPYGLDSPPRVLAGAAVLERAGVPFAFAGSMPYHDADAIRISAALAVRYGLSAATARRAMTIEPARIAGADEVIGSIEPGKQADLVVFSEDPLRLDARVLAVYIDGARVFCETQP
jgi:imidazolonepropionase-like amidohydrolase